MTSRQILFFESLSLLGLVIITHILTSIDISHFIADTYPSGVWALSVAGVI